MPTVRTTFRPDQPIEVGDLEYAQLKAEGLLVEEDPASEVPVASAPPATPKKTTGKES
jgi:hypothetical protein